MPWSVRIEGETYVIPDDTTARALGGFLSHLDPVMLSDGRFRLAVANRKGAPRPGEDDLRLAIQSGNAEAVAQLLAKGAEADGRFAFDDETPLTVAAFHGHTEIARMLLTAGAEVNALTPRGTALGLAARFGRADLVRLLVAAGADPNLHGEGQSAPVEVAAAGGHLEVVRELSSREAPSGAMASINPLMAARHG